MGVAGGPNIEREGLVFGYDTGLNPSSNFDHTSSPRRYFKGIPATNLITGNLPAYFGSSGEALTQTKYLNFSSQSGVFQRNFVTNPATADTSTFNNNAGLTKGSLQISNLSASTTYIQISFDFYLITPYVRFNNSGGGLGGYMRVQYTDDSYENHTWDTTYSNGSGDDWNNLSSYVGRWQKVSLIAGLNSQKTPSNINTFYIYMDRATQGEGVFTNFMITEHSTYPSGPVLYTDSSRSSTQSLIDLTKSTTIDVANVSFDSNGSPAFDGTNDYVDLGADVEISPINQGWTAEYVFNTNNASTLQHFNGCDEDVHNAGWIALYNSKLAVWNRSPGTWKYGDTVFSSNTWYHVVFVQTSGTTMQFYVNGEPEGGDHATYTWNADKSAFFCRYVGKYKYLGNSSRYFNGEVPITKLYNRALTAQEIQQNYKAYKNRFNL